MRGRLVRALALLASVTAAVTACAEPARHSGRPAEAGATGAVRIMLVGDSITQGSTGDYTWRYWLWHHLRNDGAAVRFVGPQHELWNSNATGPAAYTFNSYYADPTFAADSNANGTDALLGATFELFDSQIEADVRTYRPSYVVVLLGINDLGSNHTPTFVAGELRRFIANARAGEGRLKFDVVKVLPAAQVPVARITAFNRLIDPLRAQMSTAASPIVVTDPPPGYSATTSACTDTWDGIHPNTRGELKIAAAVADTLHTAFSLGSDYPRPLPVVSVGPQPPPVLTAAPGNGVTMLSWTPSLGATTYQIWRRPAGKPWGVPFPLPIAASSAGSFNDNLLVGGHTYEYRIRAAKGTCMGSFSNTASVTPRR